MNDFVTIILNGKKLQVPKENTILKICQSEGIDIPHLCHDDKLKPFSSCFLCVVEIKGYPTHQPACSTIVQDDMEIVTDSPAIRQSRKTALELLLSRHYADCLAPCQLSCPAGVDVQGYLSFIEKGLYQEALKLIKETNPLPAVCGRVCVRPCELNCRRNLTEDQTPVGIDYLKRFVADYDLNSIRPYLPQKADPNGKKIAIIGSGPAGLSAAYYLQIKGFQADIYEAEPLTGGWLRYGIPEYRLPKDILDKEIATIMALGVRIFTEKSLGNNLSYENIHKNYEASFIAIGAQLGDLLGIEEQPAPNLQSGIDFLKEHAQYCQNNDLSGKQVVVIGGGNTAMDCCRTAQRFNAEKVTILYRRTEADMPANPIEIHESKAEGVQYLFLACPQKIIYDNNGYVKALQCIKMKAEKTAQMKRSKITPIEGSEFEIKTDLILAATGQNVEKEIIQHINHFYQTEALKSNPWNNIEVNPETQQTSCPEIFAAGDAVTGPSNIIEAIAGGKRAAEAIEHFLNPKTSTVTHKPFISKKENFEPQTITDYFQKFETQARYEMPVRSIEDRHNFKEVELGYSQISAVQKEAERCLECGCNAFYNCKLQKYATLYGASQTAYMGSYKKQDINFQHQDIEIDPNKCILCGLCVRICEEYAGNHALKFMKRGSQTYIAPNIEGNLNNSYCDSCGLCIDICPTGALRINNKHKTLSLPYHSKIGIDPFGSEGFEVEFQMYRNEVIGTHSQKGFVNQFGLINRDIKFNYEIFNRTDRILQPLLKDKKGYIPISYEEAIHKIKSEISKVKASENAIWASAEHTNEILYAIQRWTRAGVKTNAISSFQYMGKGHIFNLDKNDIVPLHELANSKKIYILESELSKEHPVINHIIQHYRNTDKIPVCLITTQHHSPYSRKTDQTITISNSHYFIKMLNYHLIKNHQQFGIFTQGLALHYSEYIQNLQKENELALMTQAGITDMNIIENMINDLIKIPETVFITTEKNIDAACFKELKNLMLLTEKQGKTGSGIISLKPSCNSQGLFDMGITPKFGPGFRTFSEDYLKLLKDTWQIDILEHEVVSVGHSLLSNGFKNGFIFGENPIKTHSKYTNALKNLNFLCVQSCFLNETTAIADLILPSNFAIEIGGSFSSSFKVAQHFEAIKKQPLEKNLYQFFSELSQAFNLNPLETKELLFLDFIGLFKQGCCGGTRHQFSITK